MNRQELYERVMRRADTEGTQINAAEVSRVCSILLDELKQELTPKPGVLILEGEPTEQVVDYDCDVADEIIVNIIINFEHSEEIPE